MSQEEAMLAKRKSELVSFLFCIFASLGLWISSIYLFAKFTEPSSEFFVLPFLVFGALQMAGAFAYWLWRHPEEYFVGMVHAFLSVLAGLVTLFGFMAAIFSRITEAF